MKKYIIGISIYVAIGIIIWRVGFIEAPTVKEGIFTFLYIVFLWPIVVLLKILRG